MVKIKKENYLELYVFCMDYHSGQWSRGYRILCKLNVRNIGDEFIKECRESEIYQYLADKYAKSV